MKQSAAVLTSVRLSLSMGIQSFASQTVLLLIQLIEAMEHEAETTAADLRLAKGNVDRLLENVTQLQRELMEVRADTEPTVEKTIDDRFDDSFFSILDEWNKREFADPSCGKYHFAAHVRELAKGLYAESKN